MSAVFGTSAAAPLTQCALCSTPREARDGCGLCGGAATRITVPARTRTYEGDEVPYTLHSNEKTTAWVCRVCIASAMEKAVLEVRKRASEASYYAAAAKARGNVDPRDF